MQREGRVALWFIRGTRKGRRSPHVPNRSLPVFTNISPCRDCPPQVVDSDSLPSVVLPSTEDDTHRTRWYQRMFSSSRNMEGAMQALSAAHVPQRGGVLSATAAAASSVTLVPNEALATTLRTLPWEAALRLYRASCSGDTANLARGDPAPFPPLRLAIHLLANPSVAYCPVHITMTFVEEHMKRCLVREIAPPSSSANTHVVQGEVKLFHTVAAQLLRLSAIERNVALVWSRLVLLVPRAQRANALQKICCDASPAAVTFSDPARALLEGISSVSDENSRHDDCWPWASASRRELLLRSIWTCFVSLNQSCSADRTQPVGLWMLRTLLSPQRSYDQQHGVEHSTLTDILFDAVLPSEPEDASRRVRTIAGVCSLVIVCDTMRPETARPNPYTKLCLTLDGWATALRERRPRSADIAAVWTASLLEAATHTVNTSNALEDTTALLASLTRLISVVVSSDLTPVFASATRPSSMKLLGDASQRSLTCIAAHLQEPMLQRVAAMFVSCFSALTKAQRGGLLMHFFSVVAFQRRNVCLDESVAFFRCCCKDSPLSSRTEAIAATIALMCTIHKRDSDVPADLTLGLMDGLVPPLSLCLAAMAVQPSVHERVRLLQHWAGARRSTDDDRATSEVFSSAVLAFVGTRSICLLFYWLLGPFPRDAAISAFAGELAQHIAAASGSEHRAKWCPTLSSLVSNVLTTHTQNERTLRLVDILSRFECSQPHGPGKLSEAVNGHIVSALQSLENPTDETILRIERFLRQLASVSSSSTMELLRVFTKRSAAPPLWFIKCGFSTIANVPVDVGDRWIADVAVVLPPSEKRERSDDCAPGSEVSRRVLYRCELATPSGARPVPHRPFRIDAIHPDQWATAAALLSVTMQRGSSATQETKQTLRGRLELLRGSAGAVLESLIAREYDPQGDVVERISLRLAREFGVYPEVREASSSYAVTRRMLAPLPPTDALNQLVIQQRGQWNAQTWQRAITLLRGSMVEFGAPNDGSSTHLSSSLNAEVLRRVGSASWFGAASVLSVLHSSNRPFSFSPSTASVLFQQFGASGAWSCALTLASMLEARPRISPRAWPSDSAFVACLTACRTARKWDAALAVFDDLYRRTHGGNNVAPSRVPVKLTLQFGHVAEFVAALIAPNSPIETVHVCLQRYQSCGASPHLRALFHLLGGEQRLDLSSTPPALPPATGASHMTTTMAALEVFLSVLDSTHQHQQDPSKKDRGVLTAPDVWHTALSVVSDAIQVPLIAVAPSSGAPLEMPSGRCLMSLMTILRRDRRWEEALHVYAVGKRLLTASAAHHQWVDKALYQTAATVAAHPAAWRASLAMLQDELRSPAQFTPRSRRVGGRRMVTFVNPRVADRVMHAVLCHTVPTQWVVALRIAAVSAPSTMLNEKGHHLPSHGAELLVRSSDVPMDLRLHCFDLLVQRGALPVAVSHGAAATVLSLAHDLNQQDGRKLSSAELSSIRSTSVAAPATQDGYTVLSRGIRNVDVRVKQLYDATAMARGKNILAADVRRQFVRCYYEAFMRRVAHAARRGDSKPTISPMMVSPETASVAVTRLVDVWDESRRRSSERSSPPVTATVLRDVAVVLQDVVGDSIRAQHIQEWLRASTALH